MAGAIVVLFYVAQPNEAVLPGFIPLPDVCFYMGVMEPFQRRPKVFVAFAALALLVGEFPELIASKLEPPTNCHAMIFVIHQLGDGK